MKVLCCLLLFLPCIFGSSILPFTGISWEGDTVNVEIDGKWYKLASVESVDTAVLVRLAQDKEFYWQIYFIEKFPELIKKNTPETKDFVDVVLVDSKGKSVKKTLRMTQEKFLACKRFYKYAQMERKLKRLERRHAGMMAEMAEQNQKLRRILKKLSMQSFGYENAYEDMYEDRREDRREEYYIPEYPTDRRNYEKEPRRNERREYYYNYKENNAKKYVKVKESNRVRYFNNKHFSDAKEIEALEKEKSKSEK